MHCTATMVIMHYRIHNNYYVLFMDYFAIGTRISFTDVIKQHGISTIFAESTDVFQSDFFM